VSGDAQVLALLVGEIVEDPGHGVALITCRPAKALDDVVWANARTESQWSPGAGGQVVAFEELSDLVKERHHIHATVRLRPGDGVSS